MSKVNIKENIKVNVAEKFAKISQYYKPAIAAELNGQYVKLVKFDSPFVFHHHDHEDEMCIRDRFVRDVLAYKSKRDAVRRKTLDDLAKGEFAKGDYDKIPDDFHAGE